MNDLRILLRARRAAVALAAVAATAAGCAQQQTVVVEATPAPPGTTPASTTPADSSVVGARPARRPPLNQWNVDVREHVDLWLHGFAMLMDDPYLVPYFAPGYRAEMTRVRGGTSTLLDANAATLKGRLAQNPNLTSAQFLAMYFGSWDDLERGTDRFLRVNGDVREARTQEEFRMYTTLRTYFSTAEDREWLSLLVRSLDDERGKFYRAWWLQQGAARASIRGQVESSWRTTYGAQLGRFMRGAAAREGYLLLSLPLGGEGRTINVGGRDNFIAVPLPAPGGDPREALWVAAHEIVGSTATSAVRDNSTAADERSGDVAKWTTLATVRGGAMLLARVAPDLEEGYMRHYLRLARVADPGGDLRGRFSATFPVPDRIADALQREIDAVLAGI